MTTNEVKETVFTIVANVCNIDKSVLNENSTVGDFPSWDSLGQLTILQQVQDTFEVEFEPEEMMEIEDISDIITTVQNKVQ